MGFTKRNLRVLHPSITLTAQSPREIVELLTARDMRRAWLMAVEVGRSFTARAYLAYIISVFPILLVRRATNRATLVAAKIPYVWYQQSIQAHRSAYV